MLRDDTAKDNVQPGQFEGGGYAAQVEVQFRGAQKGKCDAADERNVIQEGPQVQPGIKDAC